MAKNCHTCQHLWLDSEYYRSEWVCEKRQNNPPNVAAERKMIVNMARDDYRNRYKRCFEPFPAPDGAAANPASVLREKDGGQLANQTSGGN